jgi:hypothetical protein
MFAGSQGYLDLRRRLYRTLPSMMAESAINYLGLGRRTKQVSARTKAAS